jgi:hypothetical protein
MNNILFLNDPNIAVDLFNNESDLYKNYFIFKPDVILISAYHITSRIVQFIEDMHLSNKIYIYHYTKNPVSKIISDLSNFNIKHIVHSHNDEQNTITIPENLVNTTIFNETDNQIDKTNRIICFLDGLKDIPTSILPYLYPNQKIPIQLFNSFAVKHVQNLGLLTEFNKSVLLKNSKYYLSCGAINDYSDEASICGCCVITPEQLSNYSSIEPQYQKNNYVSYNQFLMDHIL